MEREFLQRNDYPSFDEMKSAIARFMKCYNGEETGVIFLSCDVVPDAEGYVAILSTDVASLDIPANGTQLMIELNGAPDLLAAPPPVSGILLIIDVCSQRKKTIRGLSPTTRVYGKIYCTNTAGRGPDSDVNSIMVA